MRIIAGKFKRKPLLGPPPGSTTRPMPDMVKESIFNLLRGHSEDGAVVDLFAGTGAMGLEAASRGSPRVVFVEMDRRVAGVLQKNIESSGAGSLCEVVIGDALGPAALTRCPRPVHLVFMDPPYALVRDRVGWERVVRQAERMIGLLDDSGFLVLRTPWPFFHVDEPEGGVSRVGGGGGAGSEDDLEGMIEIDLADAEAAERAFEAFEAELVEQQAARGEPVDVDLGIAGAIGPETHRYGTTAVHLYMRRREG